MSGDISSFACHSPFRDTVGIEAALGSTSVATRSGTVILENDDLPAMQIEDVKYILNMRLNLLFFGLLEDQGFRFSLSSTVPSYFITHSPNGHSYNFYRTPKGNIFVLGSQEYDHAS